MGNHNNSEKRTAIAMCYMHSAEKKAITKLATDVNERTEGLFSVSDLLRTLAVSADIQTVLDARQKLHMKELKPVVQYGK